jgi:hypothetical protein
MSLTVTSPEITYSTDGATLVFTFPFKMWQSGVNDEIEVIFQEGETDEATLSVNTDYTLSAANNDYTNGGTVTLNTGSAYAVTGKTITIKSSLPRSQTYSLEAGGNINPATLEMVLDRITRMVSEAETYSSISQTALDSSIKALFGNILCYEGEILTYENNILTY